MDHAPFAMLSEFRFFTDMTRRGTPMIPLAVMLEVVWPTKGRWLGILGRTEITKAEMRLVNPPSLLEMTKPWDFIQKKFDFAWDQQAGQSGHVLSKLHSFSLNVSPPKEVDAFKDENLPADAAWPQISSVLLHKLYEYDRLLIPTFETGLTTELVRRRMAQRSDDQVPLAA